MKATNKSSRAPKRKSQPAVDAATAAFTRLMAAVTAEPPNDDLKWSEIGDRAVSLLNRRCCEIEFARRMMAAVRSADSIDRAAAEIALRELAARNGLPSGSDE